MSHKSLTSDTKLLELNKQIKFLKSVSGQHFFPISTVLALSNLFNRFYSKNIIFFYPQVLKGGHCLFISTSNYYDIYYIGIKLKNRKGGLSKFGKYIEV